MRILLVEDEELLRMLLTEAMIDAGFEVVAAADADGASTLAETMARPDVVVSDVDLGGGMDGFGLAAALRGRWPAVPVLLMSGRGANFNGLSRGAAERFLPKPFALDALVRHVIELGGRSDGSP